MADIRPVVKQSAGVVVSKESNNIFMEKIQTFESAAQAIDLLDNGGHFYNIFTRADDDMISRSEVDKLSGSGWEKQNAVLYLDLALSSLTHSERMAVQGRFDDYLSEAFDRYKPEILGAGSSLEGVEVGSNVLVEGMPRRLEGQGHTTGYIVVPVIDVFTHVPIEETYTVYELTDSESGHVFLIAHDKDSESLPTEHLRLGGQVNHFQLSRDDESEFERFIEIHYFVSSHD